MTLAEPAPPPPSFAPGKPEFGPAKDFDPNPEALKLLEYLAWGVTAAAVAGVMIVGIQLALQLRAGEPGAGAAHFRGMFFVLGACILCMSAGPLVEFVIRPYMLAPP